MLAVACGETAGGTEVDGPAPSDGVYWTFPALPVHARLARRSLAAWLEAEGPGKEEQIHGALVIFSDVVTNAVLCADGPITVHAWLVGRRLLCEVNDRCAELSRLLEPAGNGERHRLRGLIGLLSASWWVRVVPGGGKTVGFAIELDEG